MKIHLSCMAVSAFVVMANSVSAQTAGTVEAGPVVSWSVGLDEILVTARFGSESL